ncbi:cystathionine beta-lyase/cystathionine gamma-synthase [SAR116 cluster alpha proteobacterium HIMB100]|nr:cystathionine beta-lyase/cystathionine gamma-synthase [SAR116 cluster alpha proteobacterium HIMB100]
MAQHRGELPKAYDYGRIGTPTSAAFEQAVAALYDAEACISTPSGLSAITTAILSVVKSGDHALFPDSLYGSSRRFVTSLLSDLGVEVSFYVPRANADIAGEFKENTSLLYLESPGSLTFELQDIPAMTTLARQQNVTTICDNTWGTALHYPVLKLGVDIVVEAATKYIAGHSDVNLGVAAASGQEGKKLKAIARTLGICAGPEDLYLGLRGLRTMRLRLEQSGENGILLAEQLNNHPLVKEVIHPALPGSPDYAIYSRDFSGPCGLFAFVLTDSIPQDRLDKAVENMDIFAIGDSWGGYESLIKQAHLNSNLRQFTPEHTPGHLIRVYAGIEHGPDLWADIEAMLDRLT